MWSKTKLVVETEDRESRGGRDDSAAGASFSNLPQLPFQSNIPIAPQFLVSLERIAKQSSVEPKERDRKKETQSNRRSHHFQPATSGNLHKSSSLDTVKVTNMSLSTVAHPYAA
jgi:hypothetical protein